VPGGKKKECGTRRRCWALLSACCAAGWSARMRRTRGGGACRAMLHASRRGCLLGVLHVACCVHESVLVCIMLCCMVHVCWCARCAWVVHGVAGGSVQVACRASGYACGGAGAVTVLAHRGLHGAAPQGPASSMECFFPGV
jgi:hypothetical protein